MCVCVCVCVCIHEVSGVRVQTTSASGYVRRGIVRLVVVSLMIWLKLGVVVVDRCTMCDWQGQ